MGDIKTQESTQTSSRMKKSLYTIVILIIISLGFTFLTSIIFKETSKCDVPEESYYSTAVRSGFPLPFYYKQESTGTTSRLFDFSMCNSGNKGYIQSFFLFDALIWFVAGLVIRYLLFPLYRKFFIRTKEVIQ